MYTYMYMYMQLQATTENKWKRWTKTVLIFCYKHCVGGILKPSNIYWQ